MKQIVSIDSVFDVLKNVPTGSGLPSRETGKADACTELTLTMTASNVLLS